MTTHLFCDREVRFVASFFPLQDQGVRQTTFLPASETIFEHLQLVFERLQRNLHLSSKSLANSFVEFEARKLLLTISFDSEAGFF